MAEFMSPVKPARSGRFREEMAAAQHFSDLLNEDCEEILRGHKDFNSAVKITGSKDDRMLRIAEIELGMPQYEKYTLDALKMLCRYACWPRYQPIVEVASLLSA